MDGPLVSPSGSPPVTLALHFTSSQSRTASQSNPMKAWAWHISASQRRSAARRWPAFVGARDVISLHVVILDRWHAWKSCPYYKSTWHIRNKLACRGPASNETASMSLIEWSTKSQKKAWTQIRPIKIKAHREWKTGRAEVKKFLIQRADFYIFQRVSFAGIPFSFA